MVIYTKARHGYKFALTAYGIENSRIRAKFADDYPRKDTYTYTVPQAWIDKGYVQEVKING